MIVENSTSELKKKIYESTKDIKETKNVAERIALSNYIGNVSQAINCVEDGNIIVPDKKIYGSLKNRRKFHKKLDVYEDRMLNNFIRNKKYHCSYMGEVLSGVEENFLEVEDSELSPVTVLSDSDYYDIFFQFMKSINLEELFDKFIKDRKIYSTELDYNEGCLGFTIFNPLKRDSDIFIKDFEYDIHSMFTLAHEFGHVYDLDHFDDTIEKYNDYFYKSFFGEAISKTFERLFLDFMIKNNILFEESKDKLFECNLINHDYVLASYMLSLLPDKYIENNSYLRLTKDKFLDIIKKYFISEEAIKDYVYNSVSFGISEDFVYAYGDILSMFMKEYIDEDGLSNDMLEEFFRSRCDVFSEEFMRKWGMGPANYVKLHEKQLQYLKK